MGTRKELEGNENIWKGLAIGFFIFFMVVVLILIAFLNQTVELKQQLSECQDKIPEVINGNLYIGYENGVRIGYHQDYLDENIWYRCARDCEVIE